MCGHRGSIFPGGRFLNPYLQPGGPVSPVGEHPGFYAEQTAHRIPVDAFLAAVRQHETWGKPGVPRSGHTQAVLDAVQNHREDPRLIIEPIFGLGKKQLIGRLDTKLAHVDYNLDQATCDPLARTWRGALYLWDLATGKYVYVPAQQVSGGLCTT